MLEALRILVEHESPSFDKEANDSLARRLVEIATPLTGGAARLIANAERGDHVRLEWNTAAGDAPPILILTHFDTVWPAGTLEHMPFRVEDGKAYGPGSFDMKAGLVQGLYALHALKSLNRPVGCRVVFLMTSDEEIGSHASRALIEEEAALSRCVLVLEPAAGPGGALKTSRKGTGTFRLEVEGVSAHAGLDPQKGRSAIGELAEQIRYLHGLTDHERGITVNVGMVEGGTASNVVAAHASAVVDLRVRTQADADAVIPRILASRAVTAGTRVSVSGGLNRGPMERTAGGAALYELARRIGAEELEMELTETAVGGASDGNFTARLAPTLDGLGAVGDGAHAEHEHVVIGEMARRCALVARLVEEVGK